MVGGVVISLQSESAISEKATLSELKNRIRELENLETELKVTQALLEDEIQWRRMLVEESRDPIVILDEKGKVVEANQRFARMLGFTMDEVCKLYAWDWDALLSKEQILKLIKEVNHHGALFETVHRRKNGALLDIQLSNNGGVYRGRKLIFCICRDITWKKRADKEREALINQLQESLSEIKTLRGILPLCSFCKKIRDDKGNWEQVDIYIDKHSQADITHSVCPECLKKHYPEEFEYILSHQKKE